MGYEQVPGMTGSISAGGEYDNLDTTNSNVYPKLAAEDAAAAALSAAQALAAKEAAAASAASALTSENASFNNASSAAASASSAASSATSASASAATAVSEAAQAALDAASAVSSASSASTSAATATTQAGIATTQATNALASAAAALVSKNAAEVSEDNAAISEANALASENAAAISETNAASSASSASTSATTATTQAGISTTQATNAATSASTATNQAGIATTQATNAAASAVIASASQVAAETARDQTLAAYDNFDDRYLGAKSSDPTLDNDGNALIAGALYFSTTLNYMRVYTGTIWVDAYAAGTSFLAKANNLSDLASVSTARTNLGLGTAATTDSNAYATAAQGALADTAVQSLTSTDGSVIVTTSGTTRDLSVNTARTIIETVRNESGATYVAGTVVILNGNSGNKALAVKAQSNSEANSSGTFGVIRYDLTTNSNGDCVTSGLLVGLDTSAYAAGQVLWLSPTVAGSYTTTKPVAPNHAVKVGIVQRSHANQGEILVSIANGYELEELHNVLITSVADKNIIAYDSATSLYKNIDGTTIYDAAGVGVAMAIALG